MTVAEVLEASGVTKDDADYGEQFNLCYAAMTGGMGIRAGSRDSVKKVLKENGLAPIETYTMEEFARKLDKLAKGIFNGGK